MFPPFYVRLGEICCPGNHLLMLTVAGLERVKTARKQNKATEATLATTSPGTGSILSHC